MEIFSDGLDETHRDELMLGLTCSLYSLWITSLEYSPALAASPSASRVQDYLSRSDSLVEAAPVYFADDCRLLSDVGRRPLWSNSNDMWKLLVPRTHKLGDTW